jgi:hypothetical protein
MAASYHSYDEDELFFFSIDLKPYRETGEFVRNRKHHRASRPSWSLSFAHTKFMDGVMVMRVQSFTERASVGGTVDQIRAHYLDNARYIRFDYINWVNPLVSGRSCARSAIT